MGTPDTRFGMELVRSELRQHVEAVRAAVGRALGGMLDTGRELIALKAACRHGEWGSAVQAAGVPERTAQRLMRAWREHEKHGTLANPPSVTALLEAAREVKPDSVSDLGETIRDPGPLFEQVDIFERFSKDLYADEGATYGEKVAYANWTLKPGGDSGVDLAVSVWGAVKLYARALCALCESSQEGRDCAREDCDAVDVLHAAVLAGMQGYYNEAGKAMADSARFENWYPA